MMLLRIAMLLAITLLVGCETAGRRFEYSRVCMGVRTRVVGYARSPAAGEAAAKLAFAEIERLDAIMSDYRPDSELMRLCRGQAGVPVPVSGDLLEVLARSLEISVASDGAFDVTCGPQVALWREARRSGRLPDARAVRDALARSSFSLLCVQRAEGTVTLARPDMRLDLGGIAKGYAAERAVRVLEQAGVRRCLVALAGDVFAGEAPPGQPGWRVEIRGDLSGSDSAPVAVLWLRQGGVSTSGDSEQFVEIEGVRYSHIVDPRTGLGLAHRRMVTVVSPVGMDADALATGVSVLGEHEAETLAQRFRAGFCIVEPGAAARPGVPVDRRVILHDPHGIFRWHTPPR